MKQKLFAVLILLTVIITKSALAVDLPSTPQQTPQPLSEENTFPMATAEDAPAIALNANLADKFFSNENPILTEQEKAAISIARRLEKTAINPVEGPDGSINYIYGTQQPSILCAVLQVSDVSLQAGEKVNAIELGDTARWTVEPAVSGAGPEEIQHLIIKPMDVGLETSLIVTTNLRTYHFRLRSHRTQYMPQVSFTYPEEAQKKWKAIKAAVTRERTEKTIPQTGEYLGNLSFDYEIAGDAPWKPVRVYNDGRKTIIQMPTTMEQTEAPTLLLLKKEGGAFTDDTTAMVNYRVQGNRYIVDAVFKKAILIAGVGSDQERLTITRKE